MAKPSPSKVVAVPIALTVPLAFMCFRIPHTLLNRLNFLHIFRGIRGEDRVLELKNKCEEEERKRILVEDRLKKVELEQEASVQEKGELKTEISRLTTALTKISKEADETQIKLRREQAEKSNAQQECSRLQETYQRLQRELNANELQLRSYQQQLRTSLTISRLFLATARESRLVEELNQEIMQTAAFISDSFDFARKR